MGRHLIVISIQKYSEEKFIFSYMPQSSTLVGAPMKIQPLPPENAVVHLVRVGSVLQVL